MLRSVDRVTALSFENNNNNTHSTLLSLFSTTQKDKMYLMLSSPMYIKEELQLSDPKRYV